MTTLEKLQALARRRRGPDLEARPALPPADLPAPAAAPAPGEPPLEAAVRFHVPGVGDVWLVPDADAAERLGIPAGQWLTPPDLCLLEGLKPEDRIEVLLWMRRFGGRLVTAPAPASRYGPGERGWQRWRLENLDRQIAEYRARGGRK